MYSNTNNTKYNENLLDNYNMNYQYQYPVQDDRFVGGLLAPLFLGGVAGYAIGYNRPNNNVVYPYYQQPMPMPVPVYTNNYYYPYY